MALQFEMLFSFSKYWKLNLLNSAKILVLSYADIILEGIWSS